MIFTVISLYYALNFARGCAHVNEIHLTNRGVINFLVTMDNFYRYLIKLVLDETLIKINETFNYVHHPKGKLLLEADRYLKYSSRLL